MHEQKTILLVEDEALVALLEQMTLERYGYRVLMAGSGEEAVEMVESTPGIHLILMDINLGRGMDGTEAAERILKSHEIPIIFLSSHVEREVVEKTEGITSYGYIVKSSGETVLIASIKMAFRLFEAKMESLEKERALRESESTLARSQEIAHVGSWVLEVAANHLTWSDEVYRILGLRPQEIAASIELALDFIHPDDRSRVEAGYAESVREGKDSYESVYRIVHKPSGEICWVYGRCVYECDAGGALIRSIGIVQDITERKGAEEEIRRQMAEKYILLRESRHHIKKGLASIESWISMQARAAASPEVAAALQDTIGRIRNISRLYDKMLIADDYEEIAVSVYLGDIIDSVVALSTSTTKIDVNKRLGEFALRSNLLFPLGIIVNEVLANAIKHAFAGRETGWVSISAVKNGRHVAISLQDNGIGPPVEFDSAASKGYGFALVKILCQQIHAQLTVDAPEEGGTRVVVEFDV